MIDMELPGEIVGEWAELWHSPQLHSVKVEFSPRMRTTLGRCFPRRRLVRLNERLKHELNEHLLEVLCHELAHQATYDQHGPDTKPHGPEWRRLVGLAGYPVRTRVKAPLQTRPGTRYTHRCDVCGMTRTAGRPMPRWRCAQCIEDGLGGELRIVTEATS